MHKPIKVGDLIYCFNRTYPEVFFISKIFHNRAYAPEGVYFTLDADNRLNLKDSSYIKIYKVKHV